MCSIKQYAALYKHLLIDLPEIPSYLQSFPTNPNHSKPAGILATHQPHRPPSRHCIGPTVERNWEKLYGLQRWSSPNHVFLRFFWWICFGKSSLPVQSGTKNSVQMVSLNVLLLDMLHFIQVPNMNCTGVQIVPPLFDLYPCCLKDDEYSVSTPLKIDMEPQNWWFPDVSPFPRGYVQVPC